MEKAKFQNIDISGEEYNEFTQLYLANKDNLKEFVHKSNNPKYLSWKEIKYRNWIPKKYSKVNFWKILKCYRRLNIVKLDFLIDVNKKNFNFFELSRFKNFCHNFDLNINNHSVNKGVSNLNSELIKKFIIEEAIASSQLEGANTTINVAKEMIYSNHKPKTHSETMIYNNYQAMDRLIHNFRNKELSLDLILELHGILTKNDKDINKNKRGTFRSHSDEIVIGSRYKINEYVHKAPDISFVKKELKSLILFANNKLIKDGEFIHPLIKAIILHFWIGYLHPFVDGNGRLARCIFYWYMLRNNYNFISYYPISIKLKKSPKQYAEAYINTEQDDNDLTYFIDYNIKKITEAQNDFEVYLKRNKKDSKKLLVLSKKLNLIKRQDDLLQYINNSGSYITALKYEKDLKVSKPTAIKDLKHLRELNILTEKKVGREVRYFLNWRKV